MTHTLLLRFKAPMQSGISSRFRLDTERRFIRRNRFALCCHRFRVMKQTQTTRNLEF